jgi:GNAT superfamily N-acetyltransferase
LGVRHRALLGLQMEWDLAAFSAWCPRSSSNLLRDTQRTAMGSPDITFREATATDVPGISRVRTSVRENLLTVEQLRERGITNESVAASFLVDSKGWVAERNGEIVAFAIADRASASIFALFVLPGWEDRGLGSRLLDLALAWLRANGAAHVWLTTGPRTKAAGFYERRGWIATGPTATGDIRYELNLSAGDRTRWRGAGLTAHPGPVAGETSAVDALIRDRRREVIAEVIEDGLDPESYFGAEFERVCREAEWTADHVRKLRGGKA